MALVNMLVMFIHIGAGIIWIGSLIYLRLILLPALGRAAPAVRGPLLMDLGPRTVRFILRVAEVTIVAGLINFLLMGGMVRMTASPVWSASISLGLVGALVIYILGQTVTRPVTMRIAETLRTIAGGEAPADAPALLEGLAARQRNVLSWQMGIGVAVVLTMAVARFS